MQKTVTTYKNDNTSTHKLTIMMLQQPILRIGGKVHVVRLLQCLVVKHWTAVSTKGLHALLQGLVGLDVRLGELKVTSSLGRKSDVFACPNWPHVGYLIGKKIREKKYE